jgi:D-lactate dehydrogenase (cytochrome)
VKTPPPSSAPTPSRPIEQASTRTFLLSILLVFGSASLGYILRDTLITASTPPTHLVHSTLAKEIQERRQPRYGSHAEYTSAIEELKVLFEGRGKGDRLSTDDDDLQTHGVSEWSYHEAKRPTVVVWVDRYVVPMWSIRIVLLLGVKQAQRYG